MARKGAIAQRNRGYGRAFDDITNLYESKKNNSRCFSYLELGVISIRVGDIAISKVEVISA